MSARIRQMAALAVTTAILVGIPYLLTAVVTWPTVDLSWTLVQVHARSWRLPPGVATTVLLAALWVMWGLHLFAMATEILAFVRGHRPRLRPLGPLQLVAATALGVTLTSPATAHAAPTTAESTEPAEEESEEAKTTPAHTSSPTPAAHETSSPDQLLERTRTLRGFGYDSATLPETATSHLNPTIQLIAAHGATDAPVVITGHTDTAGDADYNEELSQRRADAVADHLRSQLGENAPPIEARGSGEREASPDADDATQRRVEITYTITDTAPQESASPPPESESNSASAPTSEDHDDERHAVAMVLPAGVTLSVAAGAAAVAGAAGGYTLATRRRHHEQAPVTPGVANSDTPATANPDTAASTGHPQNYEAPDNLDEGSAQLDEHVMDELVAAPGVGLTGPGAHGAARTLIATALRNAPRTPPVRILISTDDAHQLLGEHAGALLAQRRTPIEVVDTTAEALAVAHAESVERQHQLREADVESVAELRAVHGDEAHLVPLVLLATPHSEQETELAGLLRSASDLDITAVLLGDWPRGETLTIAETGAISSTLAGVHGARWPATTSQALIALVQEFPPAGPPPPPHPDEGAPGTPAQANVDDVENEAPPTPAHEAQSGATESQDRPGARPSSARPETTDDPADEGEAVVQPVRLDLIGRVRIVVDGEVVELKRRSAYEVAALLAVHPDGLRRDEAIETMWPDEDPPRAVHRLQDAVSTLRRLLRPTRGQQALSPVTRSGDLYRLNPDVVKVDLWELTHALESVEQAPTETQRHTHLQRASELYTAELARDADYAWIEPTRADLQRRLVHALRHHAEAHADDDPTNTITLLQRAVNIAPTDEDIHAALIRTHLRHGDHDAARRSYDHCVAQLRRINTAPGSQVREVADEITQKQ